MAERHRLGDLEMSEARHHAGGMFGGAGDQRGLEGGLRPASTESIASRTHSLKSVATWSLRERAVWSRPAGATDQLGQPRPSVDHVDVLERQIDRHALFVRYSSATVSSPGAEIAAASALR